MHRIGTFSEAVRHAVLPLPMAPRLQRRSHVSFHQALAIVDQLDADGAGRHSHENGHHYPEADCPIFNAFRPGDSCRIDTEVLWCRDGSSSAAEYASYPIIENGIVRLAVATSVDISRRKHAEEMPWQSRDLPQRSVRERTEALSGALVQLRELSVYIYAVREQERNRIARGIHDELGSLLVALKMDVNRISKRVMDLPLLHTKCVSMGRLIETAVDNLGHIITDLRPSIHDHQGLWAALEWHGQEFAETAEIECEWHMQRPQCRPSR